MRPHRRASQAPSCLAAAGVLAVVLLELFAWSGSPAKGETVTIHLYGRFVSPKGWSVTPGSETDPGPTLSANQGDRIAMQLTGEDGAAHIFWIDYNGNGLVDANEPESPQFTVTTPFTFDALQPGTFTYWCAIHKPAMRGTWVTNVSDVTAPTIASVSAVPSQQAPGGFVNLTAAVTDDTAVTSVAAHVVGPSMDVNLTMARQSSDEWYVNRTYAGAGTYAFTVWALDARGNARSRSGSFSVGMAQETPSNYGLLVIAGAIGVATVLGIGVWWRQRSRRRGPN